MVRRQSKEDKKKLEKHNATIKPAAGVTLSPGWDPFTILLIHLVYPYDEHTYSAESDVPYIVHGDMSPEMMKLTAEIIRDIIDPAQYGEVALPFIVITGKLCSLYVTTLDSNGHSQIQVVGYPIGGNGRNKDLFTSPSEARKIFFLVLAVLINKFRTFFEANCRAQYENICCVRIYSCTI